MKNLLLLLFICTSIAYANDDKTKSNLKEVTVYLDGAQITRTASVMLNTGTTEFVFSKLSPNIIESSIQVSGLENASILSINYGINYLSKQDYSEDIKVLQEQIKKLQDDIQFEDDLISGYSEELSLIQANKRLGNETEVVSLEKLKQFATYYRERLTALRNDIYASEKKKKGYNNEIADIKKQLSEFNVDDKVQTGEIKVKLNTSSPNTLNLIIKYNVTNAGWFPIYDLKAEKINAPLKLAYKAHVYQTTGNDWKDIKLTLSTSDPNTNNIKPDVNPKFLNFVNRNYNRARATKSYNYKYNPLVNTVKGVVTSSVDGLPLPGVNVIEKGTSNGVQTDFDGNFSIKPSGGKELVFSFVGMNTEELPIHSSVMNVSMDENLEALDEVVVVGYGTTRRHNVSAAVSTVKAENITGALSGKAAGVTIRGSRSIRSSKSIREKQTSNGDIIEEGIANTRFEIKKPYTIATDGDVTVIEIENYSVPASYSYFAAPVVNENVFLTAKIGNWEQYNLLPAEANVYFEGSYSGKTNINPQATTDSLTVSLGVDPNVVVKRNQLNDFKKTTFIGSNKIINKAYKIELKNNKLTNIDLVVYDRIPVSQNKDIKVDDIETGTSEYDDKKGLMTWKLTLNAKASVKKKFSYAVKYPKYKKVNL